MTRCAAPLAHPRRFLRLLALAAAVAALTVMAQTPQAIDAGGAADVTTLTTRVEAIDYASRVIAIRGLLGRTVALKVDDRVRNLGKVKQGDQIVLRYVEALTIVLSRAGVGRSETVVSPLAATAPAAAKPGRVPAPRTTVVATIEQVDAGRNMVLLEGPNGRYAEVKVMDPGLLRQLNAGDTVNITFTEALVIDVVTPAK